MEVKAIKPAFFNGSRVREGQVLEVPEGTKGSWFAPVGTPEAEVARPKGKKPPATLSELAKQTPSKLDDLT